MQVSSLRPARGAESTSRWWLSHLENWQRNSIPLYFFRYQSKACPCLWLTDFDIVPVVFHANTKYYYFGMKGHYIVLTHNDTNNDK